MHGDVVEGVMTEYWRLVMMDDWRWNWSKRVSWN